MKIRNFSWIFPFVGFLFITLIQGCDNGDVKKASGEYSVTVVNPAHQSSVGTASVGNSGDYFSVTINSNTGKFAFSGQMTNNQITATYKDSEGSDVTALLQFSVDRSTFTGNIQTASGLYIVSGSHL